MLDEKYNFALCISKIDEEPLWEFQSALPLIFSVASIFIIWLFNLALSHHSPQCSLEQPQSDLIVEREKRNEEKLRDSAYIRYSVFVRAIKHYACAEGSSPSRSRMRAVRVEANAESGGKSQAHSAGPRNEETPTVVRVASRREPSASVGGQTIISLHAHETPRETLITQLSCVVIARSPKMISHHLALIK